MDVETSSLPLNNNNHCVVPSEAQAICDIKSSSERKKSEISIKCREKVETLRRMFKEEYVARPEIYDEADLKRVMNKDYWVTRFISDSNEPVKDAFEKLRSTMEWRKSFGVNRFDPKSIPKEIYQVAALVPYQTDRLGRPVLYIRGKFHRKIGQLEEKVKQYLVNIIESLDSVKETRESWLLIIDATDANFFNTDLDMIMFLFSTLRNRYPKGVCQALVYGLPWILGAFVNMVLSFLPSDSVAKIKFVGKKEISEMVDESNLPDWLGGSCTVNYRRVPKGCPSCYDIAENEFGMSRAEVDKLIKPFLPFLKPELCVEVDV